MGLLDKNDSAPRWVDTPALRWTPEEPLAQVTLTAPESTTSLFARIRAFFVGTPSSRWVDSPELTWTPYEPMNLAPSFARIRRNTRR
jgi:hypothetical protein